MARWTRRRAGPVPSAEIAAVFGQFEQTLRHVEEAKALLAAAAPRGRTGGVPLAEALARFEEELGSASRSMPAWRTDEVEEQWLACRSGLAEAERRERDLRLEGSPEGYEQLYSTLGAIMEPLDEAFTAALHRFRDLGV
jgi:hypothetical protein